VSDSLVINEIYLSLQGESTFAGLPCIFVRLTACNLRCSYCDTAYAFTEGRRRTFEEIRTDVLHLAESFAVGKSISDRKPLPIHGSSAVTLPLIEFTGGEPLLQPKSADLMKSFCDDGFCVLVETSGALDVSKLDPRIRRVMDLKCPSSGEVARNRWENLEHLNSNDEIKFVIGSLEDYDWAKRTIAQHRLDQRCPLLFSWVSPLAPHQQDRSLKPIPANHRPMSRLELAEAIIRDRLPVRFQLQLHKYVWPADQRGV
jgi:7-carboxy-7-deazaguanine synthase